MIESCPEPRGIVIIDIIDRCIHVTIGLTTKAHKARQGSRMYIRLHRLERHNEIMDNAPRQQNMGNIVHILVKQNYSVRDTQ